MIIYSVLSLYKIMSLKLIPKIEILFITSNDTIAYPVVRLLNRVTTQVKIATMHQSQWNSREYRLLKYYWSLYLKPFNQIESKNPTQKSHLKDCLTSKQVVSEDISANSDFSEVYFVVQSIADTIRYQNKERLLQLLKTKTTNPSHTYVYRN